MIENTKEIEKSWGVERYLRVWVCQVEWNAGRIAG